VLKKSARALAGHANQRTHEWTSVGTHLTFRAELMPGRDTEEERTFAVARVLINRRMN